MVQVQTTPGLTKGPAAHTINRRYAVVLLAYFLIAYILALGARDLLVPDETRYAEIPREMIATGDWVVPHLNGLRYFEKPPLGYWANAVSLLLFGQNNFAVRLPSAVSVGLSALLIWLLVSRVLRKVNTKSDFPAFLAALVFLACFEVAGVGNIAVLDSLFSFWVTATFAAFYFASERPPGSAAEKGLLLLAGIACGLAFLTKGFLAIALPVLVLSPYLVWQRRFTDLLRMSWLPILAAALVALPWGILIGLREPEFWRFFFWNEHIHRFMADKAQHRQPFWLYFMAAPGLFMPWTFLIPAAAAGMRKAAGASAPQGRLIRFSICWLVLPFLFFSASRGKLLTYILPCFPPFAILTALGLAAISAGGKRRGVDLALAATGILFGTILLALACIQTFGFAGFRLFERPWKATMAANGLFFMVLSCFWAWRSSYGERKFVLLGLAPLLLFFIGHFTIPQLVIEQSAPGRLLQKHLPQVKSDTVVIACEEAVGAACWNLKRDDIYLLRSAGELSYGLHFKDAAGRLLDVHSAAGLIERNRGKTVLIARAKVIRALRNVLPRPLYQDDTGPQGYVLLRY